MTGELIGGVHLRKRRTKKTNRPKEIGITTLDAQHKETLRQIIDLKNDVPRIRKNIEREKKLIHELRTNPNDDCLHRVKLLDAKKRKSELESQLRDILTYKHLGKYMVGMYDVLHEYYEELHKRQEKQIQKESVPYEVETVHTNQQFREILQTKNESVERSELLHKYFSRLNPAKYGNYMLNRIDMEFCSECNVEKVISFKDGMMICPKCGISQQHNLDPYTILSYTTTQDQNAFSYQLINHFIEIITNFKGKEKRFIPLKVLDNILEKMREHDILPENLTRSKLREILKSLHYSLYYKNISSLYYCITGKEPPQQTQREDRFLIWAFNPIKESFEKYCPPDRVNFIHYHYIFRKLLEIMGLEEQAKLIPLPKSEKRLRWHNAIWACICADNGFPYRESTH